MTAAANPYHLTAREGEVARLLIEGLADKNIAQALCVKTQAVRHHMSQILRKTNSTNRVQAALRLVGSLEI